MPLSAGDKLGPYEIIAPIGAGGMGEVYQAHDPRQDRIVAIKVPETEFSERFEREAKAIRGAASFPHLPGLRRWPELFGHGVYRGGYPQRPSRD